MANESIAQVADPSLRARLQALQDVVGLLDGACSEARQRYGSGQSQQRRPLGRMMEGIERAVAEEQLRGMIAATEKVVGMFKEEARKPGAKHMIQPSSIKWSSYDVYEGPFFIGGSRFTLPTEPTFEDKILAVITATEGGSWNAINMYDRCICTVGLIQWCEGGQYSVSDMLGAAKEHSSGLLAPLNGPMAASDVVFKRNAKGRWRFHFNDGRGEVDRSEEQKQLFLSRSSGRKGDWDEGSRLHAKAWAAALATVYENPTAIQTQRNYTVPRLFQFALPNSKLWLNEARQKSTPIADAFICAYLSFAANNPTRAERSLQDAVAKWTGEAWTQDWLAHVCERLTFHSGVTIYPHRYNAIRPALERLFGIDLPDTSASLQGLLSPTEIQAILVQLGYDLGKSGPKGDGVDGAWGKKSTSALADFERRNGLKDDGLPDKATNDALMKVRDDLSKS